MTDTKWDAERLFRTYFWPLYPQDARDDLAKARATNVNPAQNPAIFAHLGEASRLFATQAPSLFFDSDLSLDFSDASVHRLSRAVTRPLRDAWAAAGSAGTAENTLFNVVVHGAAYLGECIARRHGGAWQARRPLWESKVFLRSRAGEAELAVFHWWLKSLSDDALSNTDHAGHTLADRYRTHVETPCATPENESPFLDPARHLPRLSKVRYDLFYKYLKANIPEIRDVGRDFPSPERFDELRLRWLNFLVLGGGRSLLIYGPGEHGLHLYWLAQNGFQKGLFYPSANFPEPIVKSEGEKLVILVSIQEKMQIHEMLWWGI